MYQSAVAEVPHRFGRPADIIRFPRFLRAPEDADAARSSRTITPARPERLIRALDVSIALMALLFTLPLLIFLALAVKLSDGGPAIFGHTRVGRGGRPFRCFKFRSMVLNADERLQQLLATDTEARREWEADQKLRRDPRITPLGQFLRKSSLDELPQLINVLAGEMSIVGPRPIVQSEIARYGRGYRYYCMVRPGITGLWQVSGRNNVSYVRRVALDRMYASSKCVLLNARIIVKTVPAVLMRDGSF